MTACTFLGIVAVILPLAAESLGASTLVGPFIASLPVTPRQIWLAVIVTSVISYVAYILQTYLYPRRGLLLAGLIGGVYSSTVTVVVLATKSRSTISDDREVAGAMMIAVSMMYLRVLVLVGIFRPESGLAIAPVLLVLAALAAAYGLLLRARRARSSAAMDTPTALGPEPAFRKNPLEITTALVMAGLLVIVSFATQAALDTYQESGLHALSLVVGFLDMGPFVVSVLQGRLGLLDHQILQAILLATASTNILKAFYSFVLGSRPTALAAGAGMIALAAIATAYGLTL